MLLVAMPFVTSSFLLLVTRPGAPSSFKVDFAHIFPQILHLASQLCVCQPLMRDSFGRNTLVPNECWDFTGSAKTQEKGYYRQKTSVQLAVVRQKLLWRKVLLGMHSRQVRDRICQEKAFSSRPARHGTDIIYSSV